MRISFLVPKKNIEVAYPLIKWRRGLRRNNIHVNISDNVQAAKKSDCLILTNAFCKKVAANEGHSVNNYIRKFSESLKRPRQRLFLFDTYDAAACHQLSLLPFLDGLWKRQIFKNKEYYSSTEYSEDPCPWHHEFKRQSVQADIKELDKIKCAWNIGFGYNTRFKKVEKLLQYSGLTLPQKIYAPSSSRRYIASLRVDTEKPSAKRGHRARAEKSLQGIASDRVVNGGAVSLGEYFAELRQSATVVSPFGVGEVCYRDFEAILNGACLIKPSMNHLRTFPDIYVPYVTYVPVHWDFSDLVPLVSQVEESPVYFSNIAKQAQEKLVEQIASGSFFVDYLRKLLV